MSFSFGWSCLKTITEICFLLLLLFIIALRLFFFTISVVMAVPAVKCKVNSSFPSFYPTVTKCLVIGGCLTVGFLCIIVEPLPKAPSAALILH